MCFSTGASFGAGIVLSVIGGASIRKAPSGTHLPFASIPFLFSLQQFSEGLLWLSLSDLAYGLWQHGATLFFLFFAQVLWPCWVPFSILLLLPKDQRNRSGYLFLLAGSLVSVYLAYCLLNYPVSARIEAHHIAYQQLYPAAFALPCGVLYLIATIAPPFLSKTRRMWMLGTAILIAYLVSSLFYAEYLVSVWCFFASVISLAVFVIMEELKGENETLAGLKSQYS
ncbi:MAG: hypothetical protein JNL88_08095 [Bacteroidia bacterium]|nr:hypothetical protein [Bacteroidia bacterium]